MPPKYHKQKKIQSNNFSNAKYLIIVESPSKCAKIEHFLGIDYCCIASKGHLRQLKGLKSIDTSVIKKSRAASKMLAMKKIDSLNISLSQDDTGIFILSEIKREVVNQINIDL